MYIYIYIYIYVTGQLGCRPGALPADCGGGEPRLPGGDLEVYIYIYIHIHTFMCIYIYIYTHASYMSVYTKKNTGHLEVHLRRQGGGARRRKLTNIRCFLYFILLLLEYVLFVCFLLYYCYLIKLFYV